MYLENPPIVWYNFRLSDERSNDILEEVGTYRGIHEKGSGDVVSAVCNICTFYIYIISLQTNRRDDISRTLFLNTSVANVNIICICTLLEFQGANTPFPPDSPPFLLFPTHIDSHSAYYFYSGGKMVSALYIFYGGSEKILLIFLRWQWKYLPFLSVPYYFSLDNE